jgi:hypothetical protein
LDGPSSLGPHADGLAEILLGRRHAEFLGDVEDAEDADGGVDQEAGDGLRRARRLALGHLVDRRHRLAEILHDIADPALDRLGHPEFVGHRDRPDDQHVDRAVDREHEPVGDLQRIPRLAGFLAGARTQAGRGGHQNDGEAEPDTGQKRPDHRYLLRHPEGFGKVAQYACAHAQFTTPKFPKGDVGFFATSNFIG